MTEPSSRPPVSVKMTFWIGKDGADISTCKDDPPTEEKTFSQEQGAEPARLGLPPGVEPTKPSAGSYSGMHDHGPLVPPREGGEMAQLIGCVQDAKMYSDEYLTKVIEDEKRQKGSDAPK